MAGYRRRFAHWMTIRPILAYGGMAGHEKHRHEAMLPCWTESFETCA